MKLKSESEVQQEIMLEGARHGCVLQRNNSGAGTFVDEESGNRSFVRFGLFNLSKEQNKKIKSSDLIACWRCYFVAIEVKKEGWRFNPKDEREQAQLAYINFIRSNGGIAGFCASVDDFKKLLGIT